MTTGQRLSQKNSGWCSRAVTDSCHFNSRHLKSCFKQCQSPSLSDFQCKKVTSMGPGAQTAWPASLQPGQSLVLLKDQFLVLLLRSPNLHRAFEVCSSDPEDVHLLLATCSLPLLWLLEDFHQMKISQKHIFINFKFLYRCVTGTTFLMVSLSLNCISQLCGDYCFQPLSA